MLELGHPKPPKAFEFLKIFPEPRNVIPQWYKTLLDYARAYTQQGGVFCITPKPRKGYGWIARSVIKKELQNEAETDGLDQVEDIFSEGSVDIDGSDAIE